MEKKLICTDLDGTLLNTFGKITPLNISVIRELQRQGHLFSICTGRICQSARYYASHFADGTAVIASGGSVIQLGGMTWYRAEQDRNLLERVYDITQRYGATATFQSEDTLYITKGIPEFLAKFGSNKGVPKNQHVIVKPIGSRKEFLEHISAYVFVSLMCLNQEKRSRLRAELAAVPGISVTAPMPGILDVTTVPVDKGTSIMRLAEHFGIRREDIIIFGDGENDLAMMEVAGTSIAMSNAVTALKAKAHRITFSNDRSGVGRALMEMFGIQ